MTTREIADKFVALCRQGQFEGAQRELFDPEVISIEPYATENFGKEVKGLPSLQEKARKFTAMLEQVHSVSLSDPLVAGEAFAVAMQLEMTIRGHGRLKLDELCIYEVKDGRIVSERFTSRFPI